MTATLPWNDLAITSAPPAQQQESSYSLGVRYQASLEELLSAFREASEEGWDGYGAAPATPETLEYAARFLQTIPSNLPMPEISIEPDGEISFEWYDAPRWVYSVSIGPRGTLTYAGLFGRNKAHGVEQLVDEIPPTILRQLGRHLRKAST